ncbi:hypothetical protein AAFF_G00310980 [Aldrovandia affinis]|uniref:Uncharacterized protein n=1 Tax=Aldrovandia affinis TaxID=143900 RepID=A0AAD7W004_9TELE|nr:hypothetical protein AAFF_G00310980 [Aldrovandia affinis]
MAARRWSLDSPFPFSSLIFLRASALRISFRWLVEMWTNPSWGIWGGASGATLVVKRGGQNRVPDRSADNWEAWPTGGREMGWEASLWFCNAGPLRSSCPRLPSAIQDTRRFLQGLLGKREDFWTQGQQDYSGVDEKFDFLSRPTQRVQERSVEEPLVQRGVGEEESH